MDSFVRLLKMDKAESQRLLLQATQLEIEGKLEEALQCCQAVIQQDRNSAEAFNLQGIVLEQLGRCDEAMASWREALIIDPDDNDARENLGDLQRELREPTVRPLLDAFRVGLLCSLVFVLIQLMMNLPIYAIWLTAPDATLETLTANLVPLAWLLSLTGWGISAGLLAKLSWPTRSDWARYVLFAVAGVVMALLVAALIPITVLMSIGDVIPGLGVSFRSILTGLGFGMGIAMAMRATGRRMVLMAVAGALSLGFGTFLAIRLLFSFLVLRLMNPLRESLSQQFIVQWSLQSIVTFSFIGLAVGGLHQYFYSKSIVITDDEENLPNDK